MSTRIGARMRNLEVSSASAGARGREATRAPDVTDSIDLPNETVIVRMPMDQVMKPPEIDAPQRSRHGHAMTPTTSNASAHHSGSQHADIAHEGVVDQLVDELMLRLSLLAQLAPAVIQDRVELCRTIRRAAERAAFELERPGEQGVATARVVTSTLWGAGRHGPPDEWWRTPLGTLVSRRGSSHGQR